MGGVTCKHERLRDDQPKETILTEDKLLLWKKKVLVYTCKDCLQDVRIVTHTGKITGHEYSSQLVDSKTCNHVDHFTVDTDKTERVAKTTLGVLFLDLSWEVEWMEFNILII